MILKQFKNCYLEKELYYRSLEVKARVKCRNDRKDILTYYQKNLLKITVVPQWIWLPSTVGGECPLVGGGR